MTGAGADIWGGADAFQFLSQPVGGSIDLIAQVTSEQNTDTYAKAGLMLRQSFDPGSPMVILDVRPGGGIEFMDRSSAAGAVRFRAGASASIPIWLRLSRQGPVVTGSISPDGVNWTQVGATVFAAGDAAAGLAVTSHDTSVTTRRRSAMSASHVCRSRGRRRISERSAWRATRPRPEAYSAWAVPGRTFGARPIRSRP